MLSFIFEPGGINPMPLIFSIQFTDVKLIDIQD